MNLLVDHFLACRKPADFYRLQILLECECVPSELAAAFQYESVLPPEALDWVATTRAMMFAQSRGIQPFARRRIRNHALLYAAPDLTDEPRDLLVAFCGLADRLQVPIPVVLQHLDARRTDVLLLRDPTKRIYLQGVPGYGPGLAEVAERIRRDLDIARYRTVRTFGTSGGGWAAFTVGSMLGADRAISMSGKPPAATFRLAQAWARHGYSLDDQAADFAVFERLFDSMPDRSTRLFNFFGAEYDIDREGAEAFEKAVGAVGVGFRGVDHHNLMLELVKAARLGTFLDHYLAGDLDAITPPPDARTVDIASFDKPRATTVSSDV